MNSFDGPTLSTTLKTGPLTAGSMEVGTFMKDMWTAVVGIDLLHKVILRVRPFAEEPKQAQEVYENCLKRWVEAVEQRTAYSGQRTANRNRRPRFAQGATQGRRKTDMVGLFEQFAEEFAAVKLNHNVRKPRIGIVGEIYVRNHPFANLNIIQPA